MRRSLICAVLSALVCIPAPSLAQQGTAQLGGNVTDPQGGVLPGVTITIINEETGATRDLVTGTEGSYFASQLVPGRFRVTAKLEGFKALDRRGITLIVGQTTTLDLAMEVGGVSETVTVSGEAPLVDTSSAEIGGHITASELSDLPSANRNYMAFVGNVPGTVFVPSAEFLNDSFQANGQPTAANNIVFDGANNTDDQRGSNVGGQTRAPNEAIQEVQVLTNQFDAEWGRASGAVINAVTKSGTNQFTGSAFDLFTGKKVTNKDFFTKAQGAPKPEVGKTEWGGTLGGPIIKNKLHFFASLERIAVQRNFSNIFPNRPSENFSVASEESAWNYMWRIDHQISNKHSWAFRSLAEKAPQFNRLDGSQETRSSYGDETDYDRTMVGTLTSVLTDTKVNTVRYGGVFEDTVHANPAWRALKPEYARCVPCPAEAGIENALAPPILDYDQFDLQSSSTMDYSIQRSHSIDDTFSWFIPEAKGRHDLKFGARYSRTWLSNPSWSNMNGTYVFRANNDPVFDVNNARSYPERVTVRVPGPLTYAMVMHVGEFFMQDKWQIRPGLTVSAGLRYDLEIYPLTEDPGNPLFKDPKKYPVDKNNVAPRLGLVWNPDGQSKQVIRAGYGMFYDRTLLGTVDNFLTDLKYSPSFTANFPAAGADLGPRNGRLPDDPLLRITRVDELSPQIKAAIAALYPPGSTVRNTTTVTWDDPDRKQPYFHQVSAGYEREVVKGVSVSADFVHMAGRDMFFNPNLNIATGLDTVRDSANRIATDPFGILTPSLAPGEAPYTANTTVRLLTTKYGYSDYDALDISVEKRYSHNYSARFAYSLSYSRGVTAGQGDTPQLQTGTDLHLDEYEGPAGTDRTHNFVTSGRMEIPKTHGVTLSGTLRLLSGTPFTIQDTTVDRDRNRINFDPLPAGTYTPDASAGPNVIKSIESKGGRNGARGPGFVQLDMRIGYRARLGSSRRTLDVYVETFNVTDRVNFSNPSGDRRTLGDFLRYASLVGGTGFPRQSQLGLRFGF